MLLSLLLVAMVLVASYTDVRYRRVPNWLTGSAVAVGLIAGGLTRGLEGLLYALGGGALGLGLLLIPFLARGMGAGDVKLLAAVGALKGPGFVLAAAIYMALAGGALAVVALARRRRLLPTITEMLITRRLLSPDDPAAIRIPYAPAIAIGALLALLIGGRWL